MPISYIGAGSEVQTSTTTLTLAGHASSQAGDIHVAMIISINNGAVSAPDSTWIEISQANFTVAGTTTSFGIVAAFRGCKTTGNPFGAVTTSSNVSADAVTYATITPHNSSGQLVAVGLYAEDATTGGTVSGAVYTFAAPDIDVEQATLEDASIFMSLAPMTTNAASGAITQATTSTVDAVNQGILFDLIPADAYKGGGQGEITYPKLNRRGIR